MPRIKSCWLSSKLSTFSTALRREQTIRSPAVRISTRKTKCLYIREFLFLIIKVRTFCPTWKEPSALSARGSTTGQCWYTAIAASLAVRHSSSASSSDRTSSPSRRFLVPTDNSVAVFLLVMNHNRRLATCSPVGLWCSPTVRSSHSCRLSPPRPSKAETSQRR